MKEIERLRFAHLPTVVEDLGRLAARSGGPQLLIKRDDQTGLAFGGNKTRKLEFLVAEALAKGARMLVTAQSVDPIARGAGCVPVAWGRDVRGQSQDVVGGSVRVLAIAGDVIEGAVVVSLGGDHDAFAATAV